MFEDHFCPQEPAVQESAHIIPESLTSHRARHTVMWMPRATDAVDPNQVVAENLRALREERGWTQAETVERFAEWGLRWSKQSLSAKELAAESSSGRQFTANELVAIAAAFGVPVTLLLMPRGEDSRQLRIGRGSRVLSRDRYNHVVVGATPELLERVVSGGGVLGAEMAAAHQRMVATAFRYALQRSLDESGFATTRAAVESLIRTADFLTSVFDVAHSEIEELTSGLLHAALGPEAQEADKEAPDGDA